MSSRQLRTLMAATAAAVAAAFIASTAGCGDVRADSNYHEHSETTQYTIDITYPLDYPDLKAVSDFVAEDREKFIDWVARFGSAGHTRRYAYHVDAKTYRSATPAATSLVLTIDDDTGAAHEAHPATAFKAFTFDLTKRAPFTVDSLFAPGTDVTSVLGPMLEPMVQERYGRPTSRLQTTDLENFALTDDAVIFFFGEGQVLPGDNTGPREISVPRSELAALPA